MCSLIRDRQRGTRRQRDCDEAVRTPLRGAMLHSAVRSIVEMAGADSGVEAASRVIVVDSDSDDELEVAFLGSSAHASAPGECECAKTALIDEVTHLTKVVRQGRCCPGVNAGCDGVSTFEPIDILLTAWQHKIHQWLASPVGAEHAVDCLYKRLKRRAAELGDSIKALKAREQEYADKNCDLEKQIRSLVDQHREDLSAVDGDLEAFVETEPWLYTVSRHSHLVDAFNANKSRQKVARHDQRKVDAILQQTMSLSAVISTVTLVARTNQSETDAGQAERDQMMLANAVLDGLDQFCSLLEQISLCKQENQTSREWAAEYARMVRLAQTIERFWLLHQSALTAVMVEAVVNALSKTLMTGQLAFPIHQALERVCYELRSSQVLAHH